MTGRGLTTPAVERLVQSRSTRPVSRRATGQARKAPAPQARVELLLRKLAEAQKLGSVLVVTQISGELAAMTGLDEQGQAQSRAAVAGAQVWLKEQAAVRDQLFASLREAVEARDVEAVRTLSVTANATASHTRTGEETTIAAAAGALLTADAQERHEEIMAAKRDAERARRAAERVRALLSALRRPPVGLRSQRRAWMRSSVQKLLLAAEQADSALSAREGSMWSRGRRGPVPTACRHRSPPPSGGRFMMWRAPPAVLGPECVARRSVAITRPVSPGCGTHADPGSARCARLRARRSAPALTWTTRIFTAPSSPRPSPRSPTTGRSCWRSTTSRPSTGSTADHESDRVDLLHHQAPHQGHPRRRQPGRGPCDGVQARRVRPGPLARGHRSPPRRPRPRGCPLRKRPPRLTPWGCSGLINLNQPGNCAG